MTTADREKQLREIAQLEAKFTLENYDYMGVIEMQPDYDLTLTDAEADYVFDLVRMATPTLPDRKLEDYL